MPHVNADISVFYPSKDGWTEMSFRQKHTKAIWQPTSTGFPLQNEMIYSLQMCVQQLVWKIQNHLKISVKPKAYCQAIYIIKHIDCDVNWTLLLKCTMEVLIFESKMSYISQHSTSIKQVILSIRDEMSSICWTAPFNLSTFVISIWLPILGFS